MTNRSNGSHTTNTLIPPHGGYRKLKSYQTAEIVYDLTVEFTKRYIKSLKLREQMDGAARSGKQNIEDFLRQRGLNVWSKTDPQACAVREFAYRSNRSYETYASFLRKPESAANMLLTLIHQANYLLDQQLRALEKQFLEEGGFTERLYQIRRKQRGF